MKCAREGCLEDARWAPLLHVPVDEKDAEPLTALVRLPLCETHFDRAQAAVLLDEGPRPELERLARARGVEPDFDQAWITPVELGDIDAAAPAMNSTSGRTR